ncbi:glycoside hydrolase family 97 catalytic domain-containing protein [Halobacillus salinarum]|uniref:Glycoside hydrolase family 97 catalytic domain-containing protein n=1 Tax=Halobacillus salinarum TaxID=2932257 RepID=A0ABY4ENI5_9BACI|nr:glycoside hydrolase family 97 catalytic domain-containing protein [Halobacillus salinarum]UOQ45754.1 glycoside hydrolase family 97 catalytic domain-containing protein [Halobacillus salinarum]
MVKNKSLLGCLLVLCLFLSLPLTAHADGADTSMSSPDKNIAVKVSLQEDGTPQYQITYKGKKRIDPSSLGFHFKNQDPMDNNFEIVNTSVKTFNHTWKPVWGEKSSITNHYNELTVELQEKSGQQRKLNLVFRVYDDGVGFRYVIPKQPNVDENLQIVSEDTEFSFSDNNTSWWIPNDWDSYEYNYHQTPLSDVDEVSTPLTMKTPDGVHLTVHEAALIDYSGMALKAEEGTETSLKSILAPWPDSDVKVKKDSLPVETPWRTVQMGDTAGDLVESDMILNLNEPTDYKDTSWIKPMKYMGIWWEMHIDKSTWASGPKHGATTENAKKYIDFAHNYLDSENNNIGLLVEGWNEGWDGDWTENGDQFSFTESYPDFDLKEVVNYAEQNGVEYIAHNETSGDIQNYEDQMEDAYNLYESLGINAIKSGYVADNGIKDPVGQKHHGQYMVNHYNNAVKRAAEHHIMIDTHEPIKSTGLERTYPNWMSREGVMGMEYNAWSEGSPPDHLTILPFTRMMAGPIDYNPGIFDVQIEEKPTNRVHTTRAQQLALYVTVTSGTQMVTDLPENYTDEEGNILPEFEFIKDVPVTWDDTMVPNSKIGDYITTVHRSGDEWYIGTTTDEHARDLDVSLNFLDKDKMYVAEVYSDGQDADWETNPNPVEIDKVIVESADTFTASLAAGGGQAVRIYPASEEEAKELPAYNAPNVEVNYKDVPNEIQSNDALNVKVEAENKGTVVTSKKLDLMVNGSKAAEKTVRIAPGNTKEITLTYDQLFETGDYQISINDLEEKTVKVKEKAPTFAYSDLEVTTDNGVITAKAKVTNYGSTKGTTEVPLKVDGMRVKSEHVEVPAGVGGESKMVFFTYDTGQEAGAYEVAIGDLEPKLVAVPTIGLKGEWRFHKGDNMDWKSPDLDESGWETVTLPNSWEDHSNYTEDNVFGWYRKTITVPREWKGYDLKVRLGRIDDVDETFMNGEKVAQSGTFPTGEGEQGLVSAWDWDREYVIPAETIRYGEKNVISTRVFDASFGGGLYQGPLGPIELVRGDETDDTTDQRLAGKDRYETAIEIAREGWKKSDTVVIARGDRFADALAGAPLAYKENAPILLTKTDRLLADVRQEIERLGAEHAIILGGPNAVSSYAKYQLEGIGLSVERIHGKNRYETAASIAARLDGNPEKAIVANGSKFPDALSVAPYAAENGYPILLTKNDQLPNATKRTLQDISASIVVGGESVVNKDLLHQLPNATRVNGDHRFETAAKVAEELYDDTNTAFISTGYEFADALTGSVLAAKHNAVSLLVKTDKVPESTQSVYSRMDIKNLYILGGPGAVSKEVREQLSPKHK